jgi:hypothetical protein
MVRKIILVGFLVFLPIGVQAQGRGAMPPVFRTAGVAPRAIVSPSHAVIAQGGPGTRGVVRSGTPRPRTGLPVTRNTRRIGTTARFANNQMGFRTNCASAPGFGFDEAHLAATCGPGPRGVRGGALQYPFFFPLYEGGFYVPGAAAAVEEGATADAAQPEILDSENRDRGRRYRASEPEAAPPVQPASAGPADNDEFVFVRRDGTVFFAVAYSWEKGTLRYINSQGLRHTVTQDALDLDATRQFNEQRGLNFRLPA